MTAAFLVDVAGLVDRLAPWAIGSMLAASVVVLVVMLRIGPRYQSERAFAWERLVLIVLFARLVAPLAIAGRPVPAIIDLGIVAAMTATGLWLALAIRADYRAERRRPGEG